MTTEQRAAIIRSILRAHGEHVTWEESQAIADSIPAYMDVDAIEDHILAVLADS